MRSQFTPSNADEGVIVAAQEHGQINIGPELIFDGGRLRLFPEVAQKGLVRVTAAKGELKVSATCWVGLIPLNERVVLEVRPRVPIRNMELLLEGSHRNTQTLATSARSYGEAQNDSGSFFDLIAGRFADVVELISRHGLEFRYQRQVSVGPSVIGAVMPFSTALRQNLLRDPTQAVSSSWVRTVDIPLNQMLRAALHALHAVCSSARGRPGSRKLLSKLAIADVALTRVSLDHRRWLSGSLPQDIPNRADYQEAARLASIILSGGGLNLRERGRIWLPPILVNMERVFEEYCRSKLAGEAPTSGYLVQDGNIEPPNGASKSLYSECSVDTPNATPDLVVTRKIDGLKVVGDVKYKPLGPLPDRDDLNQVITYSVVYGCQIALLIYPHRKPNQPIVREIGKVGRVVVGAVLFDLDAEDLAQEPRKVMDALAAFLSAISPPP